MKHCKWIVCLVFILLYALIVFRFIQKRQAPVTPQPVQPIELSENQEIDFQDMTTTDA